MSPQKSLKRTAPPFSSTCAVRRASNSMDVVRRTHPAWSRSPPADHSLPPSLRQLPGAGKRISYGTHVSHLLASWGTLYELTKLSDVVRRLTKKQTAQSPSESPTWRL